MRSLSITNSGPAINLSVPAFKNYILRASEDLVHWTAISTNTCINGTVEIRDTAAPLKTRRFYSAEEQFR